SRGYGAPTRLCLSPAGRLTFRRVTGPLSNSYSRIRPEPPAADSAWSLPGLWHRDDSSSSSSPPDSAGGSAQNAWVTFGEYRWVSFGERRSADSEIPALLPVQGDDHRPARILQLQGCYPRRLQTPFLGGYRAGRLPGSAVPQAV